MLEIENLAEFRAGYEKWLKEAEKTAINAYRGLAAYAFSYIVSETPQYSGEAASNWRFSVGSPELSYTSGIKLKRIVKRSLGRTKTIYAYNKQGFDGDWSLAVGSGANPEAIRIARNSLRSGFRDVKSLDVPIFIANATEFTGGVGKLEEGGTWLRAVNRPGQMVGRAVSYIGESFGQLTAQSLQRLMVMPA